MAKIKTTKRYNESYTPIGVYYDFVGNLKQALDFKNMKNASASPLSRALGAAGQLVGQVGGTAISGGLESGAGKVFSGLGNIASAIPGPWGAVTSAGLGIIGGLTNRMFGSKLNHENIAKVEGDIDRMNSTRSDAGDFDTLNTTMANTVGKMDFSNSYIGKDGWFSNKSKNKANALREANNRAAAKQSLAFINNAEQISADQLGMLEANYAAFGGPIFSTGAIGYDLATKDLNSKQMKVLGDMRLTSLPNSFSALPDVGSINTFSKGGGIHIKKKNRGKFTDYCGGKVTSECIQRGLHSSNPTTRKRANFARNARKWHSFGGWLNSQGGDFTNGVTFIDNGGSHEANPFEGVQMGVDPQGVPNLVEEGEVIYNDYVFSNRMKVPKTIRQKYKLRDNITFADAAKKLGKESEERPNDPISQRGLEAFMSALAESQEEVRIKNEDRRMNRYAKGGKLGNLFNGTGNRSNRLNPYSNFVPLTDDSFYTPEYMDFWNWYNTNQSTPEGQAWLKRINSGEFGPIGGNTFIPQDIIRLSHDYKKGPVHNAFAAAAKQYNVENPKEAPYTPYTKRWIREKGADGEWRTQQITDEEWNSAPAGRTYLMRNPNLKEGNTITSERGDKDIYYDVIPEELPEELTDDVTEVRGIRQNPLRYAPLIGSGIAVLNDIFGGNDPDYSNADMFASAIRSANRQVGTRPIGEYLAYKPLDRMFYINQLNKNAAASRRAVQNTTGGNRAAALAGILAADYNYGENLGQMARQAEEYNQALKERVTGFNRQTNMFNSEQGTKVDMFNSELLGKQASLYGQLANMRQKILEGNRAEKSANLTNFIQGLGDLGRELTDRDTLRWLADIGALPYNTKGQYTGSNNTAAPKKSKGDKIKRNKRKGYTI